MEVHQVRYFLALCEMLNFSRAAETCNMLEGFKQFMLPGKFSIGRRSDHGATILVLS
jgi:hypothetical protein